MRLILLISVLFLGAYACSPVSTYDQTIQIESDYWLYEDQADFVLQVDDTTQVSELQLIINHKLSYPFENLYLKVYTHFPNANKKEERLSINLADKRGKWVGKCNSENCELKVYLLDRFKFPSKGEYRFSFEQHTRQDSLHGINALQLKVFSIQKEDSATME